MRAYHSDPTLKSARLAQVAAHRAADDLIKGQYWENGKGCAVGCTIHSDDHMAYETELGIPVMLAYLEDSIFEGLGNSDSQRWPERFLAAIEPGADLSRVGPRFLSWLISDPESGMIRYATAETRPAMEQVGKVLSEWDRTGKVKKAAAREAVEAAREVALAAQAAESAALAARAARAARAAVTAVWAARAAARAVEWAARSPTNHYKLMADKLIALIQACPERARPYAGLNLKETLCVPTTLIRL